MACVWDDVQSYLGPDLLQCPCGRRLVVVAVVEWSNELGESFRKDGFVGVPGIQRRTVLGRLLSVYGDYVENSGSDSLLPDHARTIYAGHSHLVNLLLV